jgi:hypothetical protein
LGALIHSEEFIHAATAGAVAPRFQETVLQLGLQQLISFTEVSTRVVCLDELDLEDVCHVHREARAACGW